MNKIFLALAVLHLICLQHLKGMEQSTLFQIKTSDAKEYLSQLTRKISAPLLIKYLSQLTRKISAPLLIKESAIKKKDLIALYQWLYPKSLIIPQSLLGSPENDPQKAEFIQNICREYNIVAGINPFGGKRSSEEYDWVKAYNVFVRRNRNDKSAFNPYRDKITLDRASFLVQSAQEILKSYLPCETINENNFIKKSSSINRIFTHAALQWFINKNKLLHVSLPRKFFIIREKKGEILKTDNAQKLINNIIKIAVVNHHEIKIHDEQKDMYTFDILADKKKNSKKPLNSKAREELKKLISSIPFDVGFDNIFTDEQGNAIIIDTEFRGEIAESSLNKLTRYK